VQHELPILLGVKRCEADDAIAARFGQIWNAWTSPSGLVRCNQQLDAHCEALGRDPSSLQRSTQALLYLSNDEAWLAPHRSDDVERPIIVGTPGEVTEIVARYAAAGCDELVVPCFTLGAGDRCLETLGLFHEEVASNFA
jgi:alkanesulfonate monooxygenase SsuD/methylene tetrahydromethanopterin reductase-like flavin-dependent oxidoreductase (luciferase family)